jgi:2-keto-4-pentenoate hydratase/2-oxohepta-3-ene-1,7-dioic acid hydratase in catechol pathway
MKLLTASDQNGIFIGLLSTDETHIIPLNNKTLIHFNLHIDIPTTILGVIQHGEEFIEELRKLIPLIEKQSELLIPLHTIKLLSPIPRPTKNIFCIGKNYVEHAIEMGSEEDIPEHPMVFTKAPTTVIGHNQPVLAHSELTNQLDYEGELAIVIGKQGRAISREEAFDYVFGYTIVNDITARDIQAKHKQFFLGKSLDTTCPIGPWIVHHTAIENPNNLYLQTYVNDELRQNSNTKHLIFDIQELISVLSKGMTLEPGDIIATGTPAGVGKGFKPARYLRSGDTIKIEIEGIGALENTIK